MFKKIQTTLEGIVDKKKDPDYIEYQRLKKTWVEKIDKKTQKNTKIIDFTEGILTIKTKNTTWKNEMLFMKEEVKKNSQTKTTQY